MKALKILLYVLGGILAVLLVGPFLVPVPPLEGTVPPEQLADEDSRFMSVNGIRVHYKEQLPAAGTQTGTTTLDVNDSKAPTFLLLHGFASSLFSWREVMSPLSEMGRVIAYDRPAFGLTERPVAWSGSNPYGPEAQVELTIGMMDALGVEKAILVGNSAGGTIAMQTALKYPQRVQALILVDAAIYEGGGGPSWIRLVANTPQMHRLGPLFVRQIQNWGLDFARSAWHDPSKITDAVWQGYRQPLKVENWDRGLWEFTAAGRDLNLDQKLDELNLPVLVMTGDDDRIVPTANSLRLADAIRGAQLAVIPDCGHIPQEECPRVFVEAVKNYLVMLGLTQ